MDYYKVKVKIEYEDDKGKVKKMTEEYLIHATCVTDAEAKIHKELEAEKMDWETTSVSITKILKVIE